LQQVARETRFWWRALEAPEPEPVSSFAAPGFQDSSPLAEMPDFTPPRARHMPITLHVPRGERRFGSPRKQRLHRSASLAAASMMLATSTAGILLYGPDFRIATGLTSEAAAAVRHGAVMAGFGIDQVSVTGHRYTHDGDVFDALDLPNVQTFWDLDAASALARIERISWVDTAQITRLYPSALRIDIRERTPAMIWTRGDNEFLIDGTGRVLAALDRGHSWQLPRLAGEGANADLRPLTAALSRHPRLAAAMLHAERVSERRWRIVMKSGTWLELGAERESEGLDQIARNSDLETVLTSSPAIIDVRTSGRISVRRRLQALQPGGHYQRATDPAARG
jgi:cell division protein FtsQ